LLGSRFDAVWLAGRGLNIDEAQSLAPL